MNKLNQRDAFISDLRAIADFFEQHPEITVMPSPYLFASDYSESAKETLRIFAKSAGHATKEFNDSEAQVTKHFPGGFMVRYDVPRNKVCERVVTGTKIIPAHTLPAREETFVPEKVEEVYEWKCPESLLGSPSKAGQAATPEVEPVSA